jgi:hypothetical protein
MNSRIRERRSRVVRIYASCRGPTLATGACSYIKRRQCRHWTRVSGASWASCDEAHQIAASSRSAVRQHGPIAAPPHSVAGSSTGTWAVPKIACNFVVFDECGDARRLALRFADLCVAAGRHGSQTLARLDTGMLEGIEPFAKAQDERPGSRSCTRSGSALAVWWWTAYEKGGVDQRFQLQSRHLVSRSVYVCLSRRRESVRCAHCTIAPQSRPSSREARIASERDCCAARNTGTDQARSASFVAYRRRTDVRPE